MEGSRYTQGLKGGNPAAKLSEQTSPNPIHPRAVLLFQTLGTAPFLHTLLIFRAAGVFLSTRSYLRPPSRHDADAPRTFASPEKTRISPAQTGLATPLPLCKQLSCTLRRWDSFS